MNTSIIKPSAIVLFFLILAILNGFIATLGYSCRFIPCVNFVPTNTAHISIFSNQLTHLTIMPFVLIGLTKAEGKEEKGTLNV